MTKDTMLLTLRSDEIGFAVGDCDYAEKIRPVKFDDPANDPNKDPFFA